MLIALLFVFGFICRSYSCDPGYSAGGTVGFQMRICPPDGTLCEVQIPFCIKIVPNGNPSIYVKLGDISYGGCDISGCAEDVLRDILENAYIKIIQLIGNLNEYQIEDCNKITKKMIKFETSACWHQIQNPLGNFFVPCETTALCPRYFEVCYDFNFHPEQLRYYDVTSTMPPGQSVQCPNGEGCFSPCNYSLPH